MPYEVLGFKPARRGRYLTRAEYTARRDTCTGQELARLLVCEDFSQQIASQRFPRRRCHVSSIQETAQLLLGVWLCALILILCAISLDALGGNSFGGKSQPLTSEQHSGHHFDSLTLDREESLSESLQGQLAKSADFTPSTLQSEKQANKEGDTVAVGSELETPEGTTNHSSSSPPPKVPDPTLWLPEPRKAVVLAIRSASLYVLLGSAAVACIASVVQNLRLMLAYLRPRAAAVSQKADQRLILPTQSDVEEDAVSPITSQLLRNREEFHRIRAKLQAVRVRLGLHSAPTTGPS